MPRAVTVSARGTPSHSHTTAKGANNGNRNTSQGHGDRPSCKHNTRSRRGQNPAASRWSSGDYAIVGTTLQIVGEELCGALDLRAGQKVLDVAAGNGNVSLAAARRWCNVVSTDYV